MLLSGFTSYLIAHKSKKIHFSSSRLTDHNIHGVTQHLAFHTECYTRISVFFLVKWRVLYHTEQILAQARHSWAFSALLLSVTCKYCTAVTITLKLSHDKVYLFHNSVNCRQSYFLWWDQSLSCADSWWVEEVVNSLFYDSKWWSSEYCICHISNKWSLYSDWSYTCWCCCRFK